MAIIFAVGVVLGIIFTAGSVADEEESVEQNGNTYIIIIINSNFWKVFFRLLIHTLLLAVAIVLLSISKLLNYCKFVVVFCCGFFLGGYIVHAFRAIGVIAILILLLYLLPEQIINLLAIFLSYCHVDECTVVLIDKFDFIRHNYEVIILLIFAYIAKLLIVFSILQIFLAII